MAVELKVPSVGESITEVFIGTWHKSEGDRVEQDENVVELESEKATFDVPAPAAGVVSRIAKKPGDSAAVGEVIAYIEETASADEQKAPKKPGPKAEQPPRHEQAAAPARADAAADQQRKREPAGPVEAAEEGGPRVMPSASRVLAEHGLRHEQVEATGPGGRVLKEDVIRHVEREGQARSERETQVRTERETQPRPERETQVRRPEPPRQPQPAVAPGTRTDEIVPMSPIRRRIAQRLVEAQQTGALLTTFNECDLSAIKALREQYGEAFQKRYGVKLGFMSFFVKAAVDALQMIPQVNAEIRGTDLVYHKYCDIGVAIGGGKGLVVPILRNAEAMSFAGVELAIADFAARARTNELTPEELRGGTFTVSNGGVYGSLMSTPIVNPPQSGVLGMHAIQERPVVINGQVVARPMMYIALTYDHRVIDGREAVTFLKRIKEVVEEPSRLLLEI
jgi:2-oxoglutarate dehydrogenase E2 component (dihydrolipoamide succinyltransferase)